MCAFLHNYNGFLHSFLGMWGLYLQELPGEQEKGFQRTLLRTPLLNVSTHLNQPLPCPVLSTGRVCVNTYARSYNIPSGNRYARTFESPFVLSIISQVIKHSCVVYMNQWIFHLIQTMATGWKVSCFQLSNLILFSFRRPELNMGKPRRVSSYFLSACMTWFPSASPIIIMFSLEAEKTQRSMVCFTENEFPDFLFSSNCVTSTFSFPNTKDY